MRTAQSATSSRHHQFRTTSTQQRRALRLRPAQPCRSPPLVCNNAAVQVRASPADTCWCIASFITVAAFSTCKGPHMLALPPLHVHTQPTVQFKVRQATSAAELRAAGYLRAYTFYSYPPDRSEYSRRVRLTQLLQQTWLLQCTLCHRDACFPRLLHQTAGAVSSQQAQPAAMQAAAWVLLQCSDSRTCQ